VTDLEPSKRPPAEYARDLEDLDTTNIETIAFHGSCWFRSIPRTLVALESEKRRLETELNRPIFWRRSLDQPEDAKTRAHCGPGSIRAAVEGTSMIRRVLVAGWIIALLAPAAAYDNVTTHRFLSLLAGERSVLGKPQGVLSSLGLSSELFPNDEGQLGSMTTLLADGAQFEDMAWLRVRNHFYNPRTTRGLSNVFAPSPNGNVGRVVEK
jgi:hypothetical protein